MIDIRPNVGKTIESLKSSGYDIFFAISDLIDNSLDANATKIDINIDFENAFISIADNGHGMIKHEIIEALKLGSEIGKKTGCLGKFGFGLKSASFSQSNMIIVSSRKNNEYCEITFDVQQSIKENEWIAFESSKNKINLKSGTTIIWEELYRFGKNAQEIEEGLKNICTTFFDFIGRVFYLFIKNGIEISLNGINIKPISPFYEEVPTSRVLEKSKLEFGEEIINLTAYDLTKVKKRNTDNELIENQGIYVYRNSRFIKKIGWLGRVKHPSLNNIRIRIDIGDKEDELLNIDFKKSNVEIPIKIKRKIINFEDNIIKIQNKTLKIIGEKKYSNNEKINFIFEKKKFNANHVYIKHYIKEANINIKNLNEFYKNVIKMEKINRKSSIEYNEELFLYEMIESMEGKSLKNQESFFLELSNSMPFRKYKNIIEKYRSRDESRRTNDRTFEKRNL